MFLLSSARDVYLPSPTVKRRLITPDYSILDILRLTGI
jgi:hypothetical protein